MRNVLVDIAVALLILIAGGSILNAIVGVDEGETAPGWVGILPLALAMIWLFWRTSRRRRQAQERTETREAEDAVAVESIPDDGYRDDVDDERRFNLSIDVGDPDDSVGDVEPSSGALDDSVWRGRLESAVRNLGRDAFEQFTLRMVEALELTDVSVERIAFDGAVECLGREVDGDASVYVICRRSFGSLGANQVRDLRQLMEGKADEGLFISNADFSSAAVREAESGDAPIELVDGSELLDLMLEQRIGLTFDASGSVTGVDHDWFRGLDDGRY